MNLIGNKKIDKFLKSIVWLLFFLYILLCFKVILFKYTSIEDMIKGNISDFRSLNLVPFVTFCNFYQIAKVQGAYLWAFSNIFGNILIFIPLGYCSALLIKRLRSFKRILIFTGIISIFIEAIQYIFCLGATDIDDLICNLMGGLLGYCTYFFANKIFNNKRLLYLFTIIAAVITFCSGFLIAKEQFGSLLGLVNYKTIYEGKDKLPDRDADFVGTLFQFSSNEISAYEGSVSGPDDPVIDFTQKQTFIITKETQFFSMHCETVGTTTVISYVPIMPSDINMANGYIHIQIWRDSKRNISHVIIDDRSSALLNEGTVSDAYNENIENWIPQESSQPDISMNKINSQPNEDNKVPPTPTPESVENKILEGYIKKIYKEYLEFELVTVEYKNGIGYLSSSTGIIAKAYFDNDTVYNVNMIKNGGMDVTKREGSKDDLKVGYRIKMNGYKNDTIFHANEITISIIK